MQLTGIVQAMVDGQPNLEDVLDKLELWMQDNSITEKNSAVVTFGDWDLASALTNQCHYLQLDVPPIFRYWINVKKSLLEFTGVWPTSLTAALQEAELEQTGRLHSGIDDCVNIAKLVRYLGQNGYVFNFTASNKHYNPPIES
ncbi:ERI1 exoribonuclease 3-like [Tropilaelaps mercedesae]|uniref:ERI1 exoribonuclease 3-like n=1 Tax=Tropilaelaps mercedesae TaxID=418985 RepID=A0A1V9X6C0_9ACAR|nr:ERI1 exoribonuclease 3-like [Tropilaelaps mercedesae]